MPIRTEGWGETGAGEAELFVLSREDMELSVTTFGAAVTSLKVPGRDAGPSEVALGYADLSGYLGNRYYLGCIVGRVANRIGNARFTLEGRQHTLDRNHDTHHLHGGARGFQERLWTGVPETMEGDPCLRLALVSEDGDQGYPGRLEASVVYRLTEDAVRIHMTATSQAPTPVNLASHIYFNLDGPCAGDCLGHRLQVNASRFQATDAQQIPTGELVGVEGTPLDFTSAKAIGRDLDVAHSLLRGEQGYDHSLVLDGGEPSAVLESLVSGRRMEMRTDSPCVHLYTGNHLPKGMPGRQGERYGTRQGLCLEAQEYVDAVNHPAFPSVILRPGEQYERTTAYRFSCI